MDPDEEYKNREQKLPNPIQTTLPSTSTTEKYTKILKELVKQCRRGHYTVNKYDLPRATHRYNNRAQGKIVEPMEQNISVLVTNLQGHLQVILHIHMKDRPKILSKYVTMTIPGVGWF